MALAMTTTSRTDPLTPRPHPDIELLDQGSHLDMVDAVRHVLAVHFLTHVCG